MSGGIDYLLVDRQTRVARGLRESYGHYAKKIVNRAGLEGAAQLSFDFDPTFETLVLHQVAIRRNGQVLSRLPRGRIKTIQRESELEFQIYDGTLSAILFLDDVRVGDVIEYAYTLRGANPILGDRFADSFSLRWGVPVGHLRWRLLFPSGRTLHVKNHNTAQEPKVKARGGETEYLWEERGLPPQVAVSDAPSWHDDGAWVQLSDFESWAEVATWGEKRFAVARPPSREVLGEVARLREAGRSPEATVLAALHFVQDEVRYLGIEIGASSHQATDPSVVLARRFGDCKDKTLLLVTLLRQLGIAADPVLVNTERQTALDAWQPTPFAFNHAVARVELAGRTYWLDPTRTAQGGALDRVTFPDYRRGLVIAPGTTGLSVLPSPNLDAPTTTARETYVVKESGPAELRVETRFEGPEADRIRASLRRQSREDVERSYLDFYGKSFAGIRATAPLEVKDEPDPNVVTTRESYEIPEFWSLSEDKTQWEFEVTASTISGLLVRPGGKERTAPLGLGQPVHVVHLTDVILPEPWNVTPESKEVTTKAGRFSYRSRYTDRKLQLEYHYRTLADAVAPADLPSYIKDVDRMRSLLSYQVWKPTAARQAAAPAVSRWAHWPVFAALGLFLPMLVVGWTVGYRYRPAPRRFPDPGVDPALDGIRGWLLLVGVGIVLSPLRLAADTWGLLPAYTADTWARLTTPGTPEYHVLWGPLLLMELLANTFFLALALLNVVLFFQKRRALPWFFIAFITMNATFLLLDGVLASVVAPNEDLKATAKDVARAIGTASIWIPYFLVSKRVKATFRN